MKRKESTGALPDGIPASKRAKPNEFGPKLLPYDLWGHVINLLAPAWSQLLRLRLISQYFDEAIVQLYIRELRDDILTDMDLVKLPDFVNLVRTWRHPQLITDLTLAHFRRDWYTPTKLRTALKTFSNLRRLTVLGDAFDAECLDQVIRHSSTTLESLCFEYHSRLSGLPQAAAGRLRSLRALSVQWEPPPQPNLQMANAMFPGGSNMTLTGMCGGGGMPPSVGQNRYIDSEVASFLIQCIKTFVQVQELRINVQTQQATTALLNYLLENETTMRSLSFTGFFDWVDVGRILEGMQQLRELRIQSTDESNCWFKMTTSQDTPRSLTVHHDSLAYLSAGGFSRPLEDLELHCPALRTAKFLLPFKATHLDLSECPMLEGLQLARPSDPSPSGIDDTRISINKLSLPPHGKLFKELLMSNLHIENPLEISQQCVEVVKYENGSKLNSEEDGVIRMNTPAVKCFHCDVTKANTLTWIAEQAMPDLEELSLVEVFLGDRTTQDPAQADAVPMKVISRKEVPIYLIKALISKFPKLTKLTLVFSPVNLYLTSIDYISHNNVRELNVAANHLDSINMPNLQKLSFSYLHLPPKCLASIFDTNLFPSLREARISGWAGAGTRAIASQMLHHLDLDVVDIPRISCPNLVTLKLSVRAKLSAEDLLSILDKVPNARNVELLCPIESSSDHLLIRHPQLLRLSIDKLCGAFSFDTPLLEYLVLQNTDMLNVVNLNFPEVQFVTLGSPKLKPRFQAACARLEKLTVLRDATRQTRSAGRQSKGK